MTLGRGTDWSPDGRFVLSAVQNPTTRRDLWALRLDGDRQPVAIAQTAFEEPSRFSPDGRWVAYQSNGTGRTRSTCSHSLAPLFLAANIRIHASGKESISDRRQPMFR